LLLDELVPIGNGVLQFTTILREKRLLLDVGEQIFRRFQNVNLEYKTEQLVSYSFHNLLLDEQRHSGEESIKDPWRVDDQNLASPHGEVVKKGRADSLLDGEVNIVPAHSFQIGNHHDTVTEVINAKEMSVGAMKYTPFIETTVHTVPDGPSHATLGKIFVIRGNHLSHPHINDTLHILVMKTRVPYLSILTTTARDLQGEFTFLQHFLVQGVKRRDFCVIVFFSPGLISKTR
jgi:hypothetical protein